MKQAQQILLSAGLATLAAAQGLDFAQLNAAPTLASGPAVIDSAADGVQTASVVTTFSISGAALPKITNAPGVGFRLKKGKRDVAADPNYTPYYPALAPSPTGFTTFPGSTTSTDASHPCPTQPEAGTYCGFLNPLDPCAPQPDGYGPVPSPDTASAFLSYAPLHSSAQAAPTSIPSTDNTHYNQVFKDLNCAVSAQSYIALYTFQSYDVNKCALYCDNTTLCTSFNIFAERDPSLNPTDNDSTADTVWGYSCPNPPSMTSFKCTLWGSAIDASMATNCGQTREQFDIVITGSDGYDKTNNTTPPDCTGPSVSSTIPSTSSASSSSSSSSTSATSTAAATTSSSSSSSSVSSSSASTSSSSSSTTSPVKPTTTSTSTSTTPAVKTTSTSAAPTCSQTYWTGKPGSSSPWGHASSCGNRQINAPSYYMGARFFPGPFNPQACSDYAVAQNTANQKACKPQCQMFNSAYLHKNGKPYGTYCSLYSQSLGFQWATQSPTQWQWWDRYDCKQSWTYSLQH